MLIELEPREMTPSVMQDLEDRGLIIRLSPGHHSAKPDPGKSGDLPLYIANESMGPHKLIVATIDSSDPVENFGFHLENEEFLLIGEEYTKPLYLTISLHQISILNQKIINHTLSAADFVTLMVKFNDPHTSFFTMLKNVPHGESTILGPGKSASFYVTEPRDMKINRVDFLDYKIQILNR